MPRRAARTGAPDVRAYLRHPRVYEREIERLHLKHLAAGRLYAARQDGVPLASFVQNRSKLARLIARAVERGEYRLEPAEVRRIRVEGRERTVYSFRLTDLIVHGAVSSLVREAMEPRLSSRLFSYRKGRSWWTAVSELAAYVRAHRRSRPDPRDRGIYVLRRDVDAYTDSIPVGEGSRLWPWLRDLLEDSGPPIRPSDWALIQTVVRPVALGPDGSAFSLFRGVPTGQPVSCVLFNLYLHQFDRELESIPGAFYARYSDDILFAHPDPATARKAASRIERLLAELGLGTNSAKSRDLYLTGAGRRSAEWPEAAGTTAVPFLGCRVSADGTVSLDRRKLRRLLRDIEGRALRTAAALGDVDLERKGRLVCAVINRALDPAGHVFGQRSAPLVRVALTDRRQLREMDYWLARIVLRAVLRDAGVRAFRRIPYRRIRDSWGLVSVLHARNVWPERP